MMNWYQLYGFNSNPFSIKPAAFHNEIIGYELQDVFEKIDSGNVLFIKGDYGFGKTTILKHIIMRFGGKKQVIYHSTSRGQLNIEKLLLKRSLMNSLFKNMPYDMILLVDEAQHLSKEEIQEINRFYNEGNLKSAVFLGTTYKKNVFTKELNQALKNNLVVLGNLSDSQAVELIRKRVGNIKLLPDEAIVKIYRMSQLNPRRFLELCEDIARYAVENGYEVVNDDVLQQFFPEHKKRKANENFKKRAKKRQRKSKSKKQKIVIQELDSKKFSQPSITQPAEYNLDKVRSYEEEMSTLKEEKDLKEE